MKPQKKQELVKELYEKYPYPSRDIQKKEKLIDYVKWVSKIFEKDINYWKDKKILELGCGTGELANGLALCGAKINAIDLSNNSIKHAKEISKRFNTTAKFNVANILEYQTNKKYDVVIALGSLHHTINAKSGFIIATNHCKENGIIIIGLYNKYSRFRHRVKRFVLFLFARNNIEKRIYFGKKFFLGNNSKSWLADKYGQVHESYHSINEILKWFKENNVEFIFSKPKFTTPIIDEIKWFFRKEAAFFVMVGRKKQTS